MRVVSKPKRVSVMVGGALVIVGCLGIWHSAILSNGPGNGRGIVLSFFLAIFALVRGVVILFWNHRSETMVLMRMQAAVALLGILPLAFFGSILLSAFAPLIVVLALAQGTLSVWRIIEHRQVS